MFQPEVSQEIEIANEKLQFARHPSVPSMPFGQEGRQATVYRLSSGNRSLALKVFKPRYRRPYLAAVARNISKYAHLPGMEVCDRKIVCAENDMKLLRTYPDLAYAAVMPWIEGPTWLEVLLSKERLEPQTSLDITKALLKVLVALEEEGLSHGDLSAPNVMLPMLSTGSGVALVDVEQIYGPGIEKPEALPGGSPGYALKNDGASLWGPLADRFAGAVVLSEMLAFCNEGITDAAHGESFFDPEELGTESTRYDLMLEGLRSLWGGQIAGLFRLAWLADRPDDCPPFLEWLIHLPEKAPVVSSMVAEDTAKCAECGAALRKTARFCAQCGSRLGSCVCPACGRQTTGKFCQSCGVTLTRVKCSTCGGFVEPGYTFCGDCGALAVDAECSACGEILRRGQRHCVKCGTPTQEGYSKR